MVIFQQLANVSWYYLVRTGDKCFVGMQSTVFNVARILQFNLNK